jgi:hypothetical protein
MVAGNCNAEGVIGGMEALPGKGRLWRRGEERITKMTPWFSAY